MNVSAGLGELMFGVSKPLDVAPLLVVAPLEVAPLTRSRGLPVVQVWVRLRLRCKRGGSSVWFAMN